MAGWLPDEEDIVDHCGAPYAARGRTLAREGRVLPTRWTQHGEVRAWVRGAEHDRYETTIQLRDDHIEESWCTCRAEWGCRHVAATLYALRHDPDAFAGDARTPTASGHDNLPALLADLPVAEALGTDGFWGPAQAWLIAHGDDVPVAAVLGLIALPPIAPPPRRVVDVLRSRLPALMTRAADAAAYHDRAQEWRNTPPSVTVLEPLWRRAREIFAESGPRLDVISGSCWGRLALDQPESDTPTLVLRHPRRHTPVARIPLAQGDAEGPPFEGDAARAAGALLDQLLGPTPDANLREHTVRILSSPAWERTLRAVDRAIRRPDGAEDAGGMFGWKLSHGRHGGLELAPAWLAPLASRPGWKGRKLKPHEVAPADVAHPADRAALACLQRSGSHAVTCAALEMLAGHPRVVGPEGQCLVVQRATVGLQLEDVPGGGFRLTAWFGSRQLSAADLDTMGRTASDGWWVHWDEADRSVRVGPIPPACDAVLRRSQLFRSAFPEEARTALRRRIDTWSERIPLGVEGSLAGELRPATTTPILRLQPVGALGYSAEVVVRPCPGGPTFPPGEGPSQVSVSTPTGRVVVQRDADAERRIAERALEGLKGFDLTSWRCTVGRLQDALALIDALQAREDRLHVEWPASRPTVTTAEASAFRISGGPGIDWFELEGALEVEGGDVDLHRLLDAMRNRRRYVRVTGDLWCRLSDSVIAALDPLARLATARGGTLGVPPLAGLAVFDALTCHAARAQAPPHLAALEAQIREAEASSPAVPETLCATLRPYQADGFAWLARLSAWAPGACLADDMGLGKTVQALALLLHRASSGIALVVAPASVVTNWVREASRFAPSLHAVAYRGQDRARQLDGLGPGSIIITSYDLMVRDAKILAERDLHTAIFDEAQAMKNAGTQRARAARALPAAFKLLLTGTPMENRVTELWSLSQLFAPGMLGPAERFAERFAKPIASGDASARASLAASIRPFLLRRMKADVAPELPPREEILELVALDRDERARYDQVLGAARQAMQDKAMATQLFAVLMRLRQLACARALVDDDAPATSSKLERLVARLGEARANGAQALVFSQFVRLLDLADDRLREAGFRIVRLQGDTPMATRQTRVDAFQRGEADVFLISLHAGGTGLNLTAASYVFHLDPWWNPAVEQQATDRAHRIGQQRPVTVYRMVAEGTIEEQVLALQNEKRELYQALIGDNPALATALSVDDMMSLLKSTAGGAPDRPIQWTRRSAADPTPFA